MTRDDDLDAVREALRASAGEIGTLLLGKPTFTGKHQWRWGKKGSLSIEVAGPKRGAVYDHDAVDGKDLFWLIQRELNVKFPEALVWARQRLGLTASTAESISPERKAQQAADRLARRAKQEAEAKADRAAKQANARRVAAETIPLDGTPGDTYLKQTRCIPCPKIGWPESWRWHAGLHALIAIATNEMGEVERLQRIYVDAMGRKLDKDALAARDLPSAKMTLGSGNAPVRLPGPPDGPLVIAEGPETAQAVHSSTGLETWAMLGGVSTAELPLGRRIVVVADDNPVANQAQGNAERTFERAIAAWMAAGHAVVVARPWAARRHDKSDMADVIASGGPAEVRERIEIALFPHGAPPQRGTLPEAEALLAKVLPRFFSTIPDFPTRKARAKHTDEHPGAPPLAIPAVHAINADTGVGKSAVARLEMARTIMTMRRKGDMRTLVLAVPAHDLGDEQAAAFRKLPIVQREGIRVQLWRGREAPDPSHPGFADASIPADKKIAMCQDLKRVHEAQGVGLNPQTAACRVKIGDEVHECPFYSECAYQRQRTATADIWIVAHSSLAHSPPTALGDVAGLVIDEAVWPTMLYGVDRAHTVGLDLLRSVDHGPLTGLDSAHLRSLRNIAVDCLDAAPIGGLPRDLVRRTSLRPESCGKAVTYEWRRKVDDGSVYPGQDPAERKLALEALAGNRTLHDAVRIWGALKALLSDGAPERSGWIAMGVPGPDRQMRLKGRVELKPNWRVPTLLMDATMHVELLRPFWPNVQVTANIRVVSPNQHIIQAFDNASAQSRLGVTERIEALRHLKVPEDEIKNDKELARRINRLSEVRSLASMVARCVAPGTALLVAQKQVKMDLLALPMAPLPANLALAHHNNIAGRDEWRYCRSMVVVGRTLPPPNEVEELAEALTGEAIERTPRGEWYPMVDASYELASGLPHPTTTERHPHPVAEAIRWQICEGQLLQIIGRARGTRREDHEPVWIIVLTNAPLPIQVMRLAPVKDMLPGMGDEMVAHCGMVVSNAAHGARLCPGLWGTHKAARRAWEPDGDERSAPFPYRYISTIGKRGTPLVHLGEWGRPDRGLVELRYRVAGPGQKAVSAWYDPMVCPDPQARLTQALGPLALFERVGQLEQAIDRAVASTQPDPEPVEAVLVPMEALEQDTHGFEPDLTAGPPEGHPACLDVPYDDEGVWEVDPWPMEAGSAPTGVARLDPLSMGRLGEIILTGGD